MKENYQLEVLKIKKKCSYYSDEDQQKYDVEVEEIFEDFVKITHRIIRIYKNCIRDNKDRIKDMLPKFLKE